MCSDVLGRLNICSMAGPRLCNTVVWIYEQEGSVLVPCMLVISDTVDTLY
jgi:hypothetical protein